MNSSPIGVKKMIFLLIKTIYIFYQPRNESAAIGCGGGFHFPTGGIIKKWFGVPVSDTAFLRTWRVNAGIQIVLSFSKKNDEGREILLQRVYDSVSSEVSVTNL